MPHYLIDLVHKTVKPSYLEEIINHTINILMFQVIFIFSDWILIKQILVFSTPFRLEEKDFQNVLPVVLSGKRRHE